MASAKKKAPKSKKATKKSPLRKPTHAKPSASKPSAADKAALKKREAELKALQKAAEAQRREMDRAKATQSREIDRIKAQQAKELERLKQLQEQEAARRAAEKKAEQDRKAASRKAEQDRKAAERKAEQERRAAERKAEQEKRAADKEAAKLAAAAAKRKIPSTSLAATPIFRPLTADAPATLAPPPPAAKPGHADHQVVAALSYGLFAAINKTFGFAGQSVVKNAALRMLEYGYKRGWLPPKSKEPVRALNEFFGRLETMGYAEKIHVGKRGDNYVLEVQGLADFDAVHELRSMHYPLLPIFLGEMLSAIIDQYFRLRVTMEPIEFQEQKRGFNLPFSIHEPTVAPEISRLATYARTDDFEE